MIFKKIRSKYVLRKSKKYEKKRMSISGNQKKSLARHVPPCYNLNIKSNTACNMEVFNLVAVTDVAAYIIKKCGKMTTMKLEKLAYYCQAWSLAWDGKPLFNEDFQAWANGPVCLELYKTHRGVFEVDATNYPCMPNAVFEECQLETMNIVIKAYGKKSAQWLSELTHKERPWKEARGCTAMGEPSSVIIEKDIMQDYYGSLK